MRLTTGGIALAVALAASPALANPAIVPAQAATASAGVMPAAAGATPPARRRHAKGDPLEGFNRAMFSVHQTLDRLFFRPTAKTYEKIVPKLVRKGLRHFFSNLREPLVFANDMLQLKPKRAIKTLGRFTVNSTVGLAGFLDVAKTRDFDLPHHDNSFGDTLGRYGVGPGPYIFLPLVGPSDVRDLGAGIAEGQTLAFTIGTPFDRAEYRISEAVITGLDLRAESDGALTALLGGAVDPYATLRSAYLQDRAASVAELRGNTATVASPLDDPLTDPAAGAMPADPAPEAVPPVAPPAPVIDTRTTAPPVPNR